MTASQPTNTPAPESGGEITTLALLRKIQSDAIDPKTIAKADRQQLVAYLMGDGYSVADIAQILQAGERTIERDKKAIRESNAIARDPKLVEQMVGRLVAEADLAIQRIRRAMRDKGTPKAVKVDAEHRCYQIISDVVRAMQRLGYLPTAAQKFEADLTHHLGEVPDHADLGAEIRRLKHIHNDAPELVQRLELLEQKNTRAELASQVDAVSSATDDKGVSNDEDE